jgi:hypothetical protein
MPTGSATGTIVFTGAFFAGAFLAGIFFAGVFLAGTFFAGVFLAGAFLAGVFAGILLWTQQNGCLGDARSLSEQFTNISRFLLPNFHHYQWRFFTGQQHTHRSNPTELEDS